GIVAQILGVVLTPILKALFPVIKLFGLVILHAARLGSQIWNAFAKAVNAVLGWLGVNLKLINISEIDEAISTLAKLTWEEAEAKAGLTGEINAMHDAVRNVPPIFKAALVRGQVASAKIPAASVAGVSSVS